MNKLNWQKLQTGEMDWELFRLRSEIFKTIRKFFDDRGFLEVESPLLTPYPTLDSNIQSIPVVVNTAVERKLDTYLHTSPEHAMKKMLAAGAERIYFLGKVFRDGEMTPQHNPEFTMLEWYRTKADYQDIMRDTRELIQEISHSVFGVSELKVGNIKVNLSDSWNRTTVKDLFLKHTGVDISLDNALTQMREAADRFDIHYRLEDNWDTLFHRLFLDCIEPNLGFLNPDFVMDYPVHMGQMAKTKTDDQRWAERVELYIAGVEIANGYSELLDSEEQKTRFENQISENNLAGPVDNELIKALQTDIPPTGGNALGVDRLLMLFLEKTDIRDVLMFPQHEWIS